MGRDLSGCLAVADVEVWQLATCVAPRGMAEYVFSPTLPCRHHSPATYSVFCASPRCAHDDPEGSPHVSQMESGLGQYARCGSLGNCLAEIGARPGLLGVLACGGGINVETCRYQALSVSRMCPDVTGGPVTRRALSWRHWALLLQFIIPRGGEVMERGLGSKRTSEPLSFGAFSRHRAKAVL
jgi:hypothetical protein